MTKKNKQSRHDDLEFEPSSGNVFADLGLPDPEERLAKAELANQICSLIKKAGLTQVQAAKRLGIDQPKISLLMRGILKGFSIERLIRFLNILDRDVTITLRPTKKGQQAGLRVLATA
jgi:predicted XRE-type DNA-binding protein